MRLRKRTGNVAQEPDGGAVDIAKIADALAHPLRVKILRYVIRCNRDRTPVRNKDLVSASGYSQATISQHVNMLITGGLLTAHYQGTSTCYYANVGMISMFVDKLLELGD